MNIICKEYSRIYSNIQIFASLWSVSEIVKAANYFLCCLIELLLCPPRGPTPDTTITIFSVLRAENALCTCMSLELLGPNMQSSRSDPAGVRGWLDYSPREWGALHSKYSQHTFATVLADPSKARGDLQILTDCYSWSKIIVHCTTLQGTALQYI